jgi:hypothetical protein
MNTMNIPFRRGIACLLVCALGVPLAALAQEAGQPWDDSFDHGEQFRGPDNRFGEIHGGRGYEEERGGEMLGGMGHEEERGGEMRGGMSHEEERGGEMPGGMGHEEEHGGEMRGGGMAAHGGGHGGGGHR